MLSGCSGDDDSPRGSGVAGSGGAAASSTGSSHAGGGGAGASSTGSGMTGGNGGSGDGGAFDPGERCGPIVKAPRCLASGWCWQAPVPFGSDLNAIDGTADGSSLFAVGTQGAALRLCEGHWLPIETGVDVELTSVWHPSADLAVAVGAAGIVLRWDGSAWTKLVAPTDKTLRAVWGASPEQIWLGGDFDEQGPLLFELHGSEFTRVALPKPFLNGNDIFSISGRPPEVFVGGGSLGVTDSWYFDGKQWSYNLTSTDGVLREIRDFADGTALAMVPGINEDVVYGWFGPGMAADQGWMSSYNDHTNAALVALFTDATGKPAVVEDAREYALPGKTVSFDGKAWAVTEERFTALPNAIWTGTSSGYAVGANTTLLERGKDALWSPRQDVPAIIGEPIFIGGASEQALTLVTAHEIDRRGSDGWELVTREQDSELTSASVDDQGRVYVTVRTEVFGDSDVIKYYDTGWHALPSVMFAYKVFGFAPDDVWVTANNSAQHFDGVSWTTADALCEPSVVTPSRIRRAPNGDAWLLTQSGALVIDHGGSCKLLFSSTALNDVVWTASGAVWAITTWGELYQLQDDKWTMRADLLPDGASEHVHELFVSSGDTLRVAINSDSDLLHAHRLVSFDLATMTASEPMPLPGQGRLWIRGDVAYEAIAGGVLRHVGD